MSGATFPHGLLTTARVALPARRVGWATWMTRILHAMESRRLLREMDDRMLSDLGIGRAEAMAEADRAPWDLTPRHHGR